MRYNDNALLTPGCVAVDRASSFTQAEVRRSTFVEFRLGPDASAVLSDDALHGGEPNAGAFKLFVAVEPLKCSEKLVGVFRVYG